MRKNSGMALVSVLLMSALLISLYLRFMDNASLIIRLESRREKALQLQWAARAGVEYGVALLEADSEASDSYSEQWKTLSDDTASNPIIIGGCSCTVEIIDESSKANINLIDEGFLLRVFSFYDIGISQYSSIMGEELDLSKYQRLAHRILDYIDLDNNSRAFGAEEDFYFVNELGKPANSQMTDIRELYNIPGIDDKIMLASGSRPGLFDLFTVYGDGVMNLNTAKEGLIRAVEGLPSYTPERREEYFNQLFAKLPMMGVGSYLGFVSRFDWEIKKTYTNKFVTTSKWYKIKTHAFSNESNRWVEALVMKDIHNKAKIVRYVEIP